MPQNFTIQLPDQMKAIVFSDRSTEINIEIGKNHNLNQEQGRAMMSIIRQVIMKTILPGQVLEAVKHEVGLDEARAKKLGLDLLGRRFLPMQFYIGDVTALIHEFGGDVAVFQAEAETNYPEIYHPELVVQTDGEDELEENVEVNEAPPDAADDLQSILSDLENVLATPRGRSDVLYHLTALSVEVDDMIKNEHLEQSEGERMLQDLDSLSFAVNTHDLNGLERQSMRRRLSKIVNKVAAVA